MPKRKRDEVPPYPLDGINDLNKLFDDWRADRASFDKLELEDEINTLNEWVIKIKGVIIYVEKNRNKLVGKFPGLTIRQLLDLTAKFLAAIEKRLTERIVLRDKRAKFANSVIRRRSGEYAGDGNCYVTFINVGMGDCTIVTTPKGKRILIDCGSSSLSDVILDPDWEESTGPSAEEYIRQPFLEKRFLNGGDTIDFIFLTHPDEDHHNKLKEILEPMDIEAAMVYFGGAAAIEAYNSSSFIKEISGAGGSSIRRIVLCEDDELDDDELIVTKTINGRELGEDSNPDQLGAEFVDAETGAIVIYQEQNEKDNAIDFEVAVLAANVSGVWNGDKSKFIEDDSDIKKAKEMKLNGTVPNKGSLIVLIYCFQEYVLVCGDATAVTERFTVKHFADELKKVNYLRLGHHGSPTSSSRQFLNELEDMTMAVASTGGEKTRLHQLPKERIIDLVAGRVNDGAPEHDIYSFAEGDQKSHPYLEDSVKMLWATGSNGSQTITIKSTA